MQESYFHAFGSSSAKKKYETDVFQVRILISKVTRVIAFKRDVEFKIQ